MIKMPRTFKVQASAGVVNYNASIPNKDKVGRFCWEVLDALRECPIKPFANDFTLVNITHADTSKSIGVLDSPNLETMDSPIFMTFLLRGKPDSYGQKTTVIQNTHSWQIWGNSTRRYLTIYFGRAAVNKLGVQYLLEPDLRLLWNVVGSLTKAWLKTGIKEFSMPFGGYQEAHLYKQYLNRASDFVSLVEHVPLQLWPYTQVFWEECSYLFDRRLIPTGFEYYWLFYLDPVVYMPNVSTSASQFLTDMMSSNLGAGFTVLSAAINMTVQPSALGPTSVFLFAYALRAIGVDVQGDNYAETEISCRKYVQGFCKAAQELPDFKQQFVLYMNLSNAKNLGQDLYTYTTDVANTFLYLLSLSDKQYGEQQ